MCFSENRGRRLLKSSNVGHHFYTDYKGVGKIFNKSKLLSVRLHSQPPNSNATTFNNSIISNFVVYQDRLETWSLQLFEHAENSECFSIISVIIFEVNIVDDRSKYNR